MGSVETRGMEVVPHYHTINKVSFFRFFFHFPGWFFKVLVRGDNNNSFLGLEDVWSLE